jgi:hypothetical protein
MPQEQNRIDWMVRPATIEDMDEVRKLLRRSYTTLLAADYQPETLEIALPMIAEPQIELLSCGTWYVVIHPCDKNIVGCGGWTIWQPQPTTSTKHEKNINVDDIFADATSNIPELSKAVNDAIFSTKETDNQSRDTVVVHLRHFATDPLWIRRGVGQAIWKQSWSDIVSHFGTDQIDVEVFSSRTAVSFYSSLGFDLVHELDIPLSTNCLFPSVFMKRIHTKVSSSS